MITTPTVSGKPGQAPTGLSCDLYPLIGSHSTWTDPRGPVRPNGAGKTTALSMVVGLLRPDGGTARVFGIDVWDDPVAAKRLIGVLPDGMALPERLTGRELLTYLGQLRGLAPATVAARTQELLEVLELSEAERTLVTDYSAGMRKKITLATALLHTPRLLVLDEPFEAIDPVSATTIRVILRCFADAGGSGALDQVRDGGSLDDAFVRLVGARITTKGLSWLAS